jgi:hypothetical protein
MEGWKTYVFFREGMFYPIELPGDEEVGYMGGVLVGLTLFLISLAVTLDLAHVTF